MTVNDLYDNTKRIMSEGLSYDVYDNSIIPNVNMLLNELFAENNICREFYGKAPYTYIGYVTSMNDEVPLEDEYLYEIAPLGLAAKLMIDVDLNQHSIYQTQYNNARVMHQKMVSD